MTNRFWKPDSRWPVLDVTTRAVGDIPNITKAQDIFVWEDDKLVIKNPSKPSRPSWA